MAKRRGSVLAAVIVLLLILEIALASLLMSAAGEQGVGVDRLETLRARCAAEAGAQMALREMLVGIDEDGDGSVGGISDDGDATTDPSIGPARVRVTIEARGGQTVLTSTGRCGRAERIIQIIVE